MNTRREILRSIAERLVPLYDPREARSIALRLVSDLTGLAVGALLTEPDAPLAIYRPDAADKGPERADASPRNTTRPDDGTIACYTDSAGPDAAEAFAHPAGTKPVAEKPDAARLFDAGQNGPTSCVACPPPSGLNGSDLDAAVERLAAGCPVQYVTGRTEFLGRPFTVREGVLIPRPETEELTAWMIREAGLSLQPAGGPFRILDVGTGSGCIAATLAAELPGAEVYAADLSPAALEVAAENFRTLGVRVTLRRADALRDLAETFPERFDLIVSNPPYVPASDRATMHPNVRDWEPAEALFVPDDDPLRFYRAIARAGRRMLRPGGRLCFEIYHNAADAMRRMLAEEGYADTVVREDLAGKPRMTCSRN